jgi:hypothetical protein
VWGKTGIRKNYVSLLAAAGMTIAAAPAFAASAITLADFTNPFVLDFESTPTGPTAGVFPAAGITGITMTATTFGDGYNAEAGRTRALWGNESGAGIFDVGATSLADDPVFTIAFATDITRFGFSIFDQGGFGVSMEFYDAGGLVDSFGFTTATTSPVFHYVSAAAFDTLVIFGDGFGGFGLDNLTVETAAVPIPATALLLPAALLGLGALRRRKTA